MITFKHLSVTTKSSAKILHDVSGEFAPGTFHVVCGANGSGKTTLLRSLVGLIASTGDIRYDDRTLTELSPAERAKLFSWVPAEQTMAFGYSVREVILWGRWSHHRGLPTSADVRAVDAALDTMNIHSFSNRSVNELSLGEQKKVHLARAIAADTPYIFLDEPCGPLDAGVSLDVAAWARVETAKMGKTIIASLHDLSLVANFADRVIMMKQGAIMAVGPTSEIISPPHIREAFGVNLHRSPSPAGDLILMTRLN